MARNKSTLVHDAAVLCGITLISGLLVAFSHELTAGPIRDNEMAAKTAAYQTLFADAASFEDVETVSGQEVYETAAASAGKDYGKITVNNVVDAKDASGNHVGYIIDVTTGEGYGGDIESTIGVDPDGRVTGVEVLTIKETAGLGMHAKDADFRSQYVGKDAEEFSVTKLEAAGDSEIEAISGATITSRAMTNAVNAAVLTAQNMN